MEVSELPQLLRDFFYQQRRRLIAELNALEDLLGVERSVRSRDERRADKRADVLHERD